MPKRRIPPTRNSKKKKKAPETADEFLNVGIELEESGDRWLPGDKLKAGRFYTKAIESYETALQRDPNSFDATYNCARLQYQLAQSPELLDSSHITSRHLLQKALQNHRYCLVLSPENEDALFNTGQVHCSFAEALIEYRIVPAEAKAQAAQLLSEAVEIFQKCLALQERRYSSLEARQDPQSQGGMHMEEEAEPHDNIPTEAGGEGVADRMNEGSGSESGQWTIVQAPVTKGQLLDTGLAELEACTTLCLLAAEGLGKPLAWIQDIVHTLLESKIMPLSQAVGRQNEAALARANFAVALAEASFKSGGATDPVAWEASIHSAFSEWKTPTDFQALCDRADAHIQLATTTAEQGTEAAYALSWKNYAFAAQSLSFAAKLEPLKAEINIARGDVEMLRAKIKVPAAIQSRELLMKNAGVYYRGAKRLEGNDLRVKNEAVVKEAMVAFEMGDEDLLKLITLNEAVKDVVIEAVDEGIFGIEWLNRVRVKAELPIL